MKKGESGTGPMALACGHNGANLDDQLDHCGPCFIGDGAQGMGCRAWDMGIGHLGSGLIHSRFMGCGIGHEALGHKPAQGRSCQGMGAAHHSM